MAASGLVEEAKQDELIALMDAEGMGSKAFWHAARTFMKEHSDDLKLMKMGAHHFGEWTMVEMDSFFSGKLKHELIDGIFTSVDGNHDGDVKLTSIMRWLEGKVTKEEQKETIDEGWLLKQLKSLDLASMDEDGDNKLQVDELKHYFGQAGIADDIVEAVFSAIDKNGDGNITAGEFFQWRVKASVESVRKIVHETMVSRVDFSLAELGIPAAAAEAPAAEPEPAPAAEPEPAAEEAPAAAAEDAKEEEEPPVVVRKPSRQVRRATLVVQKAYYRQHLERTVVEGYLKQKGLGDEEISAAFERAEEKQKAMAEEEAATAPAATE